MNKIIYPLFSQLGKYIFKLFSYCFVLLFFHCSDCWAYTLEESVAQLKKIRTVAGVLSESAPTGYANEAYFVIDFPHRFRIVYKNNGLSLSGNKGMITYYDPELNETKKFFARNDPFVSLLSNFRKVSDYNMEARGGLIYLSTSSAQKTCTLTIDQHSLQIKSILIDDKLSGKINLRVTQLVYNAPVDKSIFDSNNFESMHHQLLTT